MLSDHSEPGKWELREGVRLGIGAPVSEALVLKVHDIRRDSPVLVNLKKRPTAAAGPLSQRRGRWAAGSCEPQPSAHGRPS
jgi:hypothetical protein